MNKEKQHIAIAEACGWVRKYSKYSGGPFVPDGTQLHWCPPPSGSISLTAWQHDRNGGILCPPDYLGSLDAMHEAEKVLDQIELKSIREYLPAPKAYNTYIDILRDVTGGVPGCFAHCTATAAQRAEAFLRTLNLWEEESE